MASLPLFVWRWDATEGIQTDHTETKEAEETGLQEECGVFGIYDRSGGDVAADIYYGLCALQHQWAGGLRNCGVGYGRACGQHLLP